MNSENLYYRKFKSSDFSSYKALVSDPRIMKYITKNPLTENEAKERFKVVMDQTNRHHDFGYFFAYKEDTNQLVGLIKLVDYKQDDFEIGYALFPKFWGQKIASEMLEYFVEYARKKHIPHLTAVVDPENPGSVKLLAKNRFIFKKEDTIKNNLVHLYELNL